ncbi:protein disulfide oxidoreductase [Halanaerobium saccharolyticum]|jgi:glutaredoxin-like protein|uniref:Glutaredoxin-like protein n=1 Tax=Halanaerobium saccharolyticum TaxID=43595 RepID=A0A2T5RT25_9FIRM|nr:thioredoxin family protein [Halanaerobium saccharolyticum]OEG63047.1 MAG: glutaredoxin [Halanaerobium sp. MDAL1]PTW03466.1 glutaredoxin-like protein [Halanaerobium saccharolyticum]TDP91722.1 glutaredoxin-like protein [Halanaerobium saccharolyticum]
MAKIDQEEKNKIKELFSKNLKDDVNLLFFSQEEGCQYCADTEEILSEVTALDEKVDFEKHLLGSEKAEEFGVDRAPAIIFLNNEGQDSGVHFYGIPSGYEFTSLIEDILDMSDHERIDLSEDIKKEVKAIDSDVLLQVFITPTCPYCPRAVRVAHQMAMLNPKVRGEMVEAMEFEELSSSFNVSGVPKTVINSGADEQVGAVPAKTILKKIQDLAVAAS